MLQAEQILQNRYQLKQKLGDNAARQTWLATDLEASTSENSQVVVKLLAFGGGVQWDNLKLFEREAQVLKHLNHPRIPKYRDYFCVDDRFLWFGLVEEYIPGSSFKELLTQGKKFTVKEVRKIAVDVLKILVYLHQMSPSVLHRDIKPSNLILGEDEQVYLVDFGAVQDKAAKEGATFTVVGTYGYTPMEQFGGRAVPASDLYALGATLIHLLTGTAPADLPQGDLRIHFSDKVIASPSFVSWVEQLTEPSIERRFSNARQALEALKLGRHSLSAPIRSLRQPGGSRIQLSKSPSQLSIELPRQQMCTLGVIGFSLKLILMGGIGLSILTATLSALVGFSFVGFSVLIIFWAVWYKILDGILVSTFGDHCVSFDRKYFAIEWRLFGSCRHRKQGLTAEIQDIFQSVLQIGQKSILEENLQREMVTIQTGEKRYSFGLGLSAVECVWLAQEIKDWLNSGEGRLRN